MSDLPSSTDPDAVVAGFNAALATADRVPGAADPVQGSLFGAAPVDPDGVGELELEALPAERRGRGRPAGSRNKSTEEWSRFILSRYRSPLLGLAEIAQSTPQDLQAALGMPDTEGKGGVTLAGALGIIMQAQTALAPYLHQKQPTAIDTGGAGLFTLVIEKGGDDAGGMRILPIEENEQNQVVSAIAAEVSE